MKSAIQTLVDDLSKDGYDVTTLMIIEHYRKIERIRIIQAYATALQSQGVDVSDSFQKAHEYYEENYLERHND